jgi:hypothetical protein
MLTVRPHPPAPEETPASEPPETPAAWLRPPAGARPPDVHGSCRAHGAGPLLDVALCCGLPVALVLAIGLVAAAVSAGPAGAIVLAALAALAAGLLLRARRSRSRRTVR